MRQCFDEAVRRGLRAANPAKLVRVRAKSTKHLEDDWLRAEEIDQLLACEALSIRDRTAYACAIGLALRLDDLLALEIEHVRLDVAVPGPHVLARVAKSDDRWHRVPVLPWLEPWLHARLDAIRAEERESGVQARYLFGTRDGGRYVEWDFDRDGAADRPARARAPRWRPAYSAPGDRAGDWSCGPATEPPKSTEPAAIVGHRY